jgi:hypothetical protein
LKSVLPSYFTALRFVCDCFGVEMPEMEAMLRNIRERQQDPDKHFPRRLNRDMLGEVELGRGPWCHALAVVGHEALYERIRRQEGRPLFGLTGGLTDRLTFALLRLYEKVVPGLNTEGVSTEEVLWVLVEDVFMPTVFLELARNWQSGLGTELQIEKCWYLPRMEAGMQVKPIQRVLRCWFRAAGFRYADDLGKVLTDSVRRKVFRWLKGECIRDIRDVHRLVDKFSDEVRWLDEPDDWKTRFTLARAVQRCCGAMDGFFGGKSPTCSLELANRLRAIGEERIAVDDMRGLGESQTFFGARLLQRRLQREGKWQAKVLAFVPTDWSVGLPAAATPEAVDAVRRANIWKANPGNWFLRLINREFVPLGLNGGTDESFDAIASWPDRMLQLGVDELNLVLNAKRDRRAATRRP